MRDHRCVAPTDLPTLAVVVPATDVPETLGRCLEAIRASEAPPEEVIAVTEPPGMGPARARNGAVRRVSADVLVFVDADVLIHPDAFVRIREAFAADPGLVALIGSYDDEPEAEGAISRFRNLMHHHVHQAGAGSAATFWTGLGAIRRETFDAAGGFREDLFRGNSIEDVELGMRLTAQGARIDLDPLVQGTHLKRWTFRGMLRADYSLRGVPWVALLLRHRDLSRDDAPATPPPTSTLNLAWRHRLSALSAVGGVCAMLARRPRLALVWIAAMVALNGRFYALLVRKGGVGLAGPAVGAHVLHHLAGVASIPGGVVLYLRKMRGESWD